MFIAFITSRIIATSVKSFTIASSIINTIFIVNLLSMVALDQASSFVGIPSFLVITIVIKELGVAIE